MHYDGPSYYRKKDKDKKELFVSKEIDIKKRQRTQASNAYQTPPLRDSHQEVSNQSNSTEKRNHFFRSKYIPPSLQKLDGWKKTEWTPELLAELKERLFKTDQSYLLFEPVLEKEQNPKEQVNHEKIAAKRAEKKINRLNQQLENELKQPVRTLNNSLSRTLMSAQNEWEKNKEK